MPEPKIQPKKYLIITPFFNPKNTYAENIVSDYLSKRGSEVHLLLPVLEKVNFTKEDRIKYKIVFLEGLRIGNHFIPNIFSINKIYDKLFLDCVITFNPLSLYSILATYVIKSRALCSASFTSEIPWHDEKKPLRKYIKSLLSKISLRNAHIIFASTPETEKYVSSLIGNSFSANIKTYGIPIDIASSKGKVQPVVIAKQFSSQFHKTWVISTRISPEKEILKAIQQFEKVLEKYDSGLILIGLTDNGASQEIVNYIKKSESKNRILALPFLTIEEIRYIFSITSFSYWNSVSVGMYESLCQGRPILAWNGQVREHLIKPGINGYWFENRDNSTTEIARMMQTNWSESLIASSIEQSDVKNHIDAIDRLIQPKVFPRDKLTYL